MCQRILWPCPDHIPEQKEGGDRGANHCDMSSETGYEGHKREKAKYVVFGQAHPDIAYNPEKVFLFFFYAHKIIAFRHCWLCSEAAQGFCTLRLNFFPLRDNSL